MAIRIREFAEVGFGRLPEIAQNDLAARFRSRRDEQHIAAALELVIHRAVTEHGGAAEVHPEILGTTHRPDFRVLTPAEYLVECTTANPSDETSARDLLRHQAADLLDEVLSDRWSVAFQAVHVGEQPLVARRFKAFARRWLAELPYDADDSQTMASYVDDGWQIELEAIALRPDVPASGTLGIYRANVTSVDVHKRIRKAIENKAGWYGPDPGLPLILAVVPTSLYGRIESVLTALLGDEEWVLRTAGPVERRRTPDGAWRSPDGIKGGLVSAVLYAPRFDLWSMADASWALLHHPGARYPAPAGIFPFARQIHWNPAGEMEEVEASMTFREFFDLPMDWPGPESDE